MPELKFFFLKVVFQRPSWYVLRSKWGVLHYRGPLKTTLIVSQVSILVKIARSFRNYISTAVIDNRNNFFVASRALLSFDFRVFIGTADFVGL